MGAGPKSKSLWRVFYSAANHRFNRDEIGRQLVTKTRPYRGDMHQLCPMIPKVSDPDQACGVLARMKCQKAAASSREFTEVEPAEAEIAAQGQVFRPNRLRRDRTVLREDF